MASPNDLIVEPDSSQDVFGNVTQCITRTPPRPCTQGRGVGVRGEHTRKNHSSSPVYRETAERVFGGRVRKEPLHGFHKGCGKTAADSNVEVACRIDDVLGDAERGGSGGGRSIEDVDHTLRFDEVKVVDERARRR